MVVIIVPITMIITAVIADATATHEPNSGQSPFWTLPGFPGNVLLGDAVSHRSGTIICTNGLVHYGQTLKGVGEPEIGVAVELPGDHP